MSDPKDGTVMIEGVEYALIAYGDERIDGVDIFAVNCHICDVPAGGQHRPGCAMGPGRPHVRAPRCRDCGVPVGALHVLGCGIEQCPRCHRQYASCDCDSSDEAPTATRNHDAGADPSRRPSMDRDVAEIEARMLSGLSASECRTLDKALTLIAENLT
jgi:hypothetical protein